MEIFTQIESYGHERVVFAYDAETGLKAIIAIHSTALGPALGGTRIWNYASEQEALTDVLRLSQGMTMKNAAAGLPLGGGKAVIIGDAQKIKTPELLKVYARYIDSLAGTYYTAEDVNTTPADIDEMKKYTDYVVGTSAVSKDPSPFTALGVMNGIRAGLKATRGSESLEGLTVAIQGLGNVGNHLCQLLSEAGANLIVYDIDSSRVQAAVSCYGAKAGNENILTEACDILAPCALGAVITMDNVDQLKCSMIAGSANNVLATQAVGDTLLERGITNLPDYIINAGGVINCAAEALGTYDEVYISKQIDAIYDTVSTVLAEAAQKGISPSRAADDYVLRIIESKKKKR